MATLEAFLPYVEPHLLGAPLPGLLHEIRQSAITFCERTRVWKEAHAVPLRAGVSAYEVPEPDTESGQVAILEEVRTADLLLQPQTPDDLKRRYQDWQTATGTPLYYTQLDPNHITLVPAPVAKGTLSVRVCCKPDRSATAVPDFLFQHYAETIAHGAVARALETRGNPYGAPKLAVYHREHFERGIHQALMQAARGFTRAPLRTRAYF